MAIMAKCPTICEEVRLPLCPAMIFFSALNEVDGASQILPREALNQALRLTVERLRANESDFKNHLGKMTELLEAWVDAGDIEFVTPFALLEASAVCDSGALEAAFGMVGFPLNVVLHRVGRELPPVDLADKRPGPIPRMRPHKYAVIIEGPNFRDERNCYPTLEDAEFVVEYLQASLKGIPLTRKGPYPSVFVSRPTEFQKATRIYVQDLRNRR